MNNIEALAYTCGANEARYGVKVAKPRSNATVRTLLVEASTPAERKAIRQAFIAGHASV